MVLYTLGGWVVAQAYAGIVVNLYSTWLAFKNQTRCLILKVVAGA